MFHAQPFKEQLEEKVPLCQRMFNYFIVCAHFIEFYTFCHLTHANVATLHCFNCLVLSVTHRFAAFAPLDLAWLHMVTL